jgi:hypothetical protein
MGGNISLSLSNLTIDSNSVLSTNYLGYLPGWGPGVGLTRGDGCTGGSGSYGGDGSYCSGSLASCYLINKIYGSSLMPSDFGSGAGKTTTCGNYDGRGAGIIKLLISNTLNLTGTITANGETGTGSYFGSGAGGSIYIITKSIVGTGNFSAKGGTGPGSGYGGGAGGGRVAVYYNTSTFTGIANSRIANNPIEPASTGTMIFVDQDDNSAIINEGFRFQGLVGPYNETSKNTTFWNSANPTYWNFTNLTIYNNTQITVNNSLANVTIKVNSHFIGANAVTPLNVYNLNFTNYQPMFLDTPVTQLNLLNSTWQALNNQTNFGNLINLQSLGLYTRSNLNGGNISLSLINLTIDPSSNISSTGLGYFYNSGPGAGGDGSSDVGAGGAYGGDGGNSDRSSAGTKYGSSLMPSDFGSGGGGNNDQGGGYGGPGGGIIRLFISNVLNLSGRITSDGGSPSGNYAGGAAGGTVFLNVYNLIGFGNISAKGSSGATLANSGGGGGGRIALYYNQQNWSGTANVSGGGNSYTVGSSGTYFTAFGINPIVSFQNPTPANNTGPSNLGSFYLNASIDEHNLAELRYSFGGNNYTIFNESVVALYNFNNLSSLGENATSVVDVANGNNGTVYGGAIWNNSGRYGGSYQFRGNGDYIETQSSSKFNLTNQSYSMWVKLNTLEGLTGYQALIAHTVATDGITIARGGETSPKNGSIIIFPNLNDYVYTTNEIVNETNKWYHIFVSVNGTSTSNYAIYINGIRQPLTIGSAGSNTPVNTGLRIGRAGSGYTHYLNGSIDDLIIFNRSLSASEVSLIYNSTLWKYNQTRWYFEINQTGIMPGVDYNYSVYARDIGGFAGQDSRILMGDNVAPSVLLNSPGNDTNTSIQTMIFNFTTIDNQATSLSCGLYLDNSLQVTNSSVGNNTLTNINSSL